MAPSIFWGPGQPLGWANWGLAWQWGPRAQVRGGRIRGFPALGSSTDVLKSKEDPFRGSSLAGAILFKVGLGRGVLLGRYHQEEGKGQPEPLVQTLTWPDPARSSQGRLTVNSLLQSQGHSVPLP